MYFTSLFLCQPTFFFFATTVLLSTCVSAWFKNRSTWSFLHVWINFVRHASCHFLCDSVTPLTIRRVHVQFCKITQDMLSQICNCLLLLVWRLYTLAMQPSTLWMRIVKWVRSMLLIAWHGTICFLHDCKNHAQFD